MKFFLAALLAAPLAHAEPLPSFRTDPAGITVSGISSGAYMAGQMHVAFSDRIEGAALVAGAEAAADRSRSCSFHPRRIGQ